MSRAPTVPPLSMPIVDKEGRLTQHWYRYLTGERSYATNVNSGVAEAAAAAVAAQATANAAAATAQAAPSAGFTVTADTTTAVIISSDLGTLTTSSITLTPSGGTAPYTYLWSKVSGDTVTITSSTAASTTFSGDPGLNGTLTGDYKCVVTDNVAATATIHVGVTIVNIVI